MTTISKKVSIIGAGNVGAMVAREIISRDLAHVALIDVVDGLAAGKALDLNQVQALTGGAATVTGSTDLAAVNGSAVIVITAGQPRVPGMTRDDLLKKNVAIMRQIAESIAPVVGESILVAVTNPLDVMTWLLHSIVKVDPKRVLGMGGVLDSARFSYYISRITGAANADIFSIVVGSHGETMVPAVSQSMVNNEPLESVVGKETAGTIAETTKQGGAAVVKLLKTGSAFFAPAASIAVMVESILTDAKKVLPACAYVNGPYGIQDTFIGVPVVLGSGGVEEIIELDLSETEKTALIESAAGIKQQCGAL